MDVRLRQARAADAEFLYELHRRTLGEAIVATWGPWDDALQRQFHEAWFDPERLSVIVCDGRDAGVLDVKGHGDGSVYLARIELLPEYQNLGVGTRLVRQVVDGARRDGATAVELDVLEANADARRLYERLGFVVVATAPPKQRMRLVIDPSGPLSGRQVVIAP